MIANIEYLTNDDFEHLWAHSVQHMAATTWLPNVLTQTAEGEWILDGKYLLKPIVRANMMDNEVLCFRENAESVSIIAFSGSMVDGIWTTDYFLCGPEDGSTSMSWIYEKIALATKAYHREVVGDLGLVGMDFYILSPDSRMTHYAEVWGATSIGLNGRGQPMYNIRWD
jgi:hypothetical protein